MMKWLIWIPVIVLGLLWWMRRSSQKRSNRP